MVREWDEEYDVVVVGSAGGALTGALLAARAGLRTVVVEKSGRLGGMAAYSGAALWLPGSRVQERAGTGDSTESARTYLRALLGEEGERGSAKREAFLAEAPALVAALEEDPALAFRHQVFPDYYERPGRVPGGRSIVPEDLPAEELGELVSLVRPPVDRDRAGEDHATAPLAGGRALIGRLLLAYDGTGNGTVHVHTRMDEVVVEDGRAVGVMAVRAGRRVALRARRGVLLAAGGFEKDAALRAEHGLPGEAAWSMAPAGTNTGDALRAAVAAGAATAGMGEGWWCPGIAMPDGGAGFLVGFHGGLVVDANGERYANESLPYDQFGRQMAARAERLPSYALFDAGSAGRLPAVTLPSGTPDAHLAAGTWASAATVAELGAAIGVPGDALAATVHRFNGFADAGDDKDFGRGEDEYARWFGEPVLRALRTPPYYAARLVLSDLGTKGGLVTDASARVLRADGSAIDGLYAAGNTTASFTGSHYPGPGVPIGSSMVFGALAARHMTG